MTSAAVFLEKNEEFQRCKWQKNQGNSKELPQYVFYCIPA